jgi:lipopolysaccharide transport system ATP-binding protein
MTVAIRIENVSKLYRLGTVGTGTLAHDLNRWWHAIRGKEDPYAKVGQVNDRTQSATNDQGQKTRDGAAPDYVWALRDINLEVQQGEILGIIGRNGAGKSTLLKLLSRVTAPTTGSIKTKGRIASLLEVGTGFHPELTGRENIYMNGAILGMRRHEISRQLDAIVEFSGCAKYLDTPVKRYSSGMTVRLGFAVAAHLDCEILIVDEVLAVGDTEFQTRCLGKMQSVASSGRTVLFVSHNLSTMKSLCKTGMLLQNGGTNQIGSMTQTLDAYMTLGRVQHSNDLLASTRPIWATPLISAAAILDDSGHPTASVPQGGNIRIRMDYSLSPGQIISRPVMGVVIRSTSGELIGGVNTRMTATQFPPTDSGVYSFFCSLKSPPLVQGSYTADLWLGNSEENIDVIENAVNFGVVPLDVYDSGVAPYETLGRIYFQPEWQLCSLEQSLGVTT